MSADAAHYFMSKQQLMSISINKLKTEAAKVGTNGVLLDSAGDFVAGTSGVAFAQTPTRRGPHVAIGSSINLTGNQASGMAIYVIQE